MVAAGSQERRMAERQANGRPGTDKGRGAGTLEAWVREPQGPGQGGSAGTLSCGLGQAAGFQSPHFQKGCSPSSLCHHLCHSLLLPAPSTPILETSNSDLLSLAGPFLLLCK